jgi:hypothetical protein
MVWDGLGWFELVWVGLDWVWDGLGCFGFVLLMWVNVSWFGLVLVGLGWFGLGCHLLSGSD